MISVEQHLERILAQVSRLQASRMHLLDAQGCVLAEDITALTGLPGFDNSAMDGYALRAADVEGASPQTPVTLDVVGDIPAGDTRQLVLPPGRAYRIMTGAPVPEGADTIVPVEDTDAGAETVAVHASPPSGRHIRREAEDVAPGEVVVRSGTRLGSRQIAVIAAVGYGEVVAVPPPRVVVISTGDELVDAGQMPGRGQIVDSNSPMLVAAVRELGALPYRVSGVPDDIDTFLHTLQSQLVRADAIITTGGVSMGAFDVVKEALNSLGTVDFHKVAMQPGKPQGFGVIGPDRTPVFTLPGNPVSALVSFEAFVAPALRVMAGRPAREQEPIRAVVTDGWASPQGKVQYTRVQLTRSPDRHTVRLAGAQGSHILGGLAAANALAVVPADVTRVSPGDTLSCLQIGPIEVVGEEQGSAA
ncbi:molybdopterin molybdochelatase [Austwickia chelonae]|uniref:Molybdopterin molybdenumtransferase n=1 Tax=Austwickia chelonae NBRC 105200 TaxID=1184607 RepID=K6VMQ0_9MICO|nr:gephyrin-like molybdotransferase Glp [Austwickia chelonae]GAB77979.1 molybdenum cofactor biosynthesis protein MoeA [Austwickia chelonae NBRC 105200]SEV93557.1 molybdopterin molybdochelatase [Austwickia chelonae]